MVTVGVKRLNDPLIPVYTARQRSNDSNDNQSNHVNFTPPTPASLLYAARCKAGGGGVLIFGGTAVAPNASSARVISRIS